MCSTSWTLILLRVEKVSIVIFYLFSFSDVFGRLKDMGKVHVKDMAVETWLRHISNAVVESRERKNWNQETLARRARVSRKTISQIENGKSAQARLIFRVLRALSLDPWTLLGGISPTSYEVDSAGQAAHDKLQELLKLPSDVSNLVTSAIDSFHHTYIRRKR